jgi:hypothetical protein
LSELAVKLAASSFGSFHRLKPTATDNAYSAPNSSHTGEEKKGKTRAIGVCPILVASVGELKGVRVRYAAVKRATLLPYCTS